jgi:hypothetical protein
MNIWYNRPEVAAVQGIYSHPTSNKTMNIKIRVFSNVIPCFLIHRYQAFRGTCYFHLQGRRINMIAAGFLECLFLTTKQHGITFQKVVIFSSILKRMKKKIRTYTEKKYKLMQHTQLL